MAMPLWFIILKWEDKEDDDKVPLHILSNIGRDKVALIEDNRIADKELVEIYANPDYDLTGKFYQLAAFCQP